MKNTAETDEGDAVGLEIAWRAPYTVRCTGCGLISAVGGFDSE